jgi:hypothetical protein
MKNATATNHGNSLLLDASIEHLLVTIESGITRVYASTSVARRFGTSQQNVLPALRTGLEAGHSRLVNVRAYRIEM